MDGAITKKQIAILTLLLVAEPQLVFAQKAFHIVKAGESLSGIAEKYFGRQKNVFDPKAGALAKILKLNPEIKDAKKVSPGMKIFLVQRISAVQERKISSAKKIPEPAAVTAPTESKPLAQPNLTIKTPAIQDSPRSSAATPIAPELTAATPVREPASPNGQYPADFFKGKLDGSVESQATVSDTSSPYPSGFLPSGTESKTVVEEDSPPAIVVEKNGASETEVKVAPPPATTTVSSEAPYPAGFLKGAAEVEENPPPLATVTNTAEPYPLGLMKKQAEAPEQEKSPLKMEPKKAEAQAAKKTASSKGAKAAKAANPESSDPMDRYPPGFLGKDPSEVSQEEAESAPAPSPLAPPLKQVVPLERPKKVEVAAPAPAPDSSPVLEPEPPPQKIEATNPMDRYPPGFLGNKDKPVETAPKVASPAPQPSALPADVYMEPTFSEPPSGGGFSYSGGAPGYGSYSSSPSTSSSSYSSDSSSSSYSSDARFPHSKLALDGGLDYYRIDGRVPANNGLAILASEASPQSRFTWEFGWSERWSYRMRFSFTADQSRTDASSTSSITGGTGTRTGYSVGAIRHWDPTSRMAFTVGSNTRVFLRSTSVSSVTADRAQLLGLTVEQEFDLFVAERIRGGVAFAGTLISGGSASGYTMESGYAGQIRGYFTHQITRAEWDLKGDVYYGFSKQNTSLIDQREQHIGLYFGVSKRFE